MEFVLREEQEELRALAAAIFGDSATRERLKRVEATDDRFDRELWQVLGAAGLLGAVVPTELGGKGLGLVELALLCEQHGRYVPFVPLPWTAAAALAIAAHGTADQRARWLPGACRGELVLTAALPASVNVAVEDGHLSGAVTGAPYAHVAAAILVAVDGSLYAVDPTSPGVALVPAETTALEIAGNLILDGAPGERLGTVGAGTWMWERLAVALAGVQAGVTGAALRMTADYVSTRRQFGRPLSSFQGVALTAADGYIDTAAIWTTVLNAAWRLDRGDDAAAEVLTAAWWAAEGGHRCVRLTQHLHGGVGADVDYPVSRYFLWGKQIELMLGGSATLARLGDLLAMTPSPPQVAGCDAE
jgi:alkylation response protein AidB-like acyl-CoA dehydrogenase